MNAPAEIAAVDDAWARVAHLRPALRAHARIHRQHHGERTWFVLENRATGRLHRLSQRAYHVLALMDGRRTVAETREAARRALGERTPGRPETAQLVQQLLGADLLRVDRLTDPAALHRRADARRRAKLRQRLRNPIAIRIPLLDPDRLLERLAPYARPLMGRAAAGAWLLCTGAAVVLAALHWDELTGNLLDRLLSPGNLLLFGLVYPLVKGLHELAHGLATKAWGGEVHETGIMLVVGMPVPYVDASAASTFPERHRRILVSAAGIAVELLLASLALFVWLAVEPGTVRSVAYNVILIGGLSTLLVNGNPLLRFDGYYVLVDLIGMPNLAARARRALIHGLQRLTVGAAADPPPAAGRGERAWLLGYGAAALAYRFVLIAGIVLLVAERYLPAGALLGIWALYTLCLKPAWQGARFLARDAAARGARPRALAVTAAAVAAAWLVLAWLPWPLTTLAVGVVWLPENAHVRAGVSGEVTALLAAPGERVTRGTPVARLDDPLLGAEVAVLEARLRELRARHEALHGREEQVRREIVNDEIAQVRGDLDHARAQLDALVVRSPADGILVLEHPQDLPGRHVEQGDALAYVVAPGETRIRVVVPQEDIGLIRRRTRGVDVRLAGARWGSHSTTAAREIPAASDRLPSKALTPAGGGRFPVDPTDPSGLRTVDKVFHLEVAAVLPDALPGQRAHVRFDHGHEPLLGQWLRRLRQLFMRRLHV